MACVLVTPKQFYRQPGEYHDVMLAAGLEVRYPDAEANLADPEVLVRQLAGVDAVLASTEPYTPAVLDRTSLRVIARAGVGYDSIDVPAATERGIVVTITPGTLEESVAEHALALILGIYRGLLPRHREVQGGHWRRGALPRLAGKTLGLVGLGRIGSVVAQKAAALGLRVIATDPVADPAAMRAVGIEPFDLEGLLAAADIVSLHCPCTAQTRNLIDAQSLSKMKSGAVLINTSRGGLVDEGALVDALRRGHLLGAGLDVFQTEPLVVESPLVALDNVLLTPHTGGLDEASLAAMSRRAAQCIVEILSGRWPLECVVNREVQRTRNSSGVEGKTGNAH